MTIDKRFNTNRPTPMPHEPLPAFAPVPRQCIRHDGWTPERQRGFIEALADTGSVKAAADRVNMTPEGAYLLRRHPEGHEFRTAWEAALKLGVQRLEDVAMERALYGVEVPVYHFGAVVGTRRVYNDRLLMFLLRNRLGERFAADARNPEHDLEELRRRLERQWREHWDRQRASENNASAADIRASIDRKLDDMQARTRHTMSPPTKALFAQVRRAHAADREAGFWEDGDEEPGDEDDEAEITP